MENPELNANPSSFPDPDESDADADADADADDDILETAVSGRPVRDSEQIV